MESKETPSNCPLCESVGVYVDSTKGYIRCTGSNREDCSLKGVALPANAWEEMSTVCGEEEAPSRVYVVKHFGDVQCIFSSGTAARKFIELKGDTKGEYYFRSFRVEGVVEEECPRCEDLKTELEENTKGALLHHSNYEKLLKRHSVLVDERYELARAVEQKRLPETYWEVDMGNSLGESPLPVFYTYDAAKSWADRQYEKSDLPTPYKIIGPNTNYGDLNTSPLVIWQVAHVDEIREEFFATEEEAKKFLEENAEPHSLHDSGWGMGGPFPVRSGEPLDLDSIRAGKSDCPLCNRGGPTWSKAEVEDFEGIKQFFDDGDKESFAYWKLLYNKEKNRAESFEDVLVAIKNLDRYVTVKESTSLRKPRDGEDGWVLHWKEVLSIFNKLDSGYYGNVEKRECLECSKRDVVFQGLYKKFSELVMENKRLEKDLEGWKNKVETDFDGWQEKCTYLENSLKTTDKNWVTAATERDEAQEENSRLLTYVEELEEFKKEVLRLKKKHRSVTWPWSDELTRVKRLCDEQQRLKEEAQRDNELKSAALDHLEENKKKLQKENKALQKELNEYECHRCGLDRETAQAVGWGKVGTGEPLAPGTKKLMSVWKERQEKELDPYEQSHALNELETEAKEWTEALQTRCEGGCGKMPKHHSPDNDSIYCECWYTDDPSQWISRNKNLKPLMDEALAEGREGAPLFRDEKEKKEFYKDFQKASKVKNVRFMVRIGTGRIESRNREGGVVENMSLQQWIDRVDYELHRLGRLGIEHDNAIHELYTKKDENEDV